MQAGDCVLAQRLVMITFLTNYQRIESRLEIVNGRTDGRQEVLHKTKGKTGKCVSRSETFHVPESRLSTFAEINLDFRNFLHLDVNRYILIELQLTHRVCISLIHS